MKTILVTTDFSETANNALRYAAHIAQVTQAELLIFNAFRLNVHASNSLVSSQLMDDLIKKNEEKLTDLSGQVSHEFKIKTRWELKNDDFINGISTLTKDQAVDLVVMGIDSNLIEYQIFGNTTTDTIKLMQFPLLVVPNDITFNGISNIMYACEASYLKGNCGVQLLSYFTTTFRANLEVFHVHTTNEQKVEAFETQINELLSDVSHTFNYITNLNVQEGILEGLENHPADLLVMIPHKMGFFESLFKGSNTSQMTVKTRVPLLIIPGSLDCNP